MSATELNRLAYDATTEAEVFQYYQTRALQLAWNGYKWNHQLTAIPGGFLTHFTKDGETFDSYFILHQFRGQGHSKGALKYVKNPIVTVKDCNVAEFFQYHNVPHRVESGIYDLPEYKLIDGYYGSRSPKRAKVFLMNHIDEGVYIMRKIGATIPAQQAYCIHPMLQGDPELKEFAPALAGLVDPYVLMLAMEYRNIANQYLSHREISSIDEIVLSPLTEVNDMLIADKIQNCKDFELHHKGKHPRSAELDKYFKFWHEKLGIHNYSEWFEELRAL